MIWLSWLPVERENLFLHLLPNHVRGHRLIRFRVYRVEGLGFRFKVSAHGIPRTVLGFRVDLGHVYPEPYILKEARICAYSREQWSGWVRSACSCVV